MANLFVGLMSGTSLDGADAVLVDFEGTHPRVHATSSIPFEESLRKRLAALCLPGKDGLDEVGACSVELADRYARAVEAVVANSGVDRDSIAAIGCHGQTVRHRPDRAFTIQIGDPARLAESTGIDVVADFRRRDMAAGGQGAPLVPAFHDRVFRHDGLARAIVNVGGISNLTRLAPGMPASGFDCGPGNVLLDAWVARHRGTAFDEGGRWAASGTVMASLLSRLLADPYFRLPPPKSTGRERFNVAWLEGALGTALDPADVQATLLELTARSIAEAIAEYAPDTAEIFLCGGGARNGRLRERLAKLSGGLPVSTTESLGVPPGDVEAVAFAWLARQFILKQETDLTAVTGARHPCLLGALYPA